MGKSAYSEWHDFTSRGGFHSGRIRLLGSGRATLSRVFRPVDDVIETVAKRSGIDIEMSENARLAPQGMHTCEHVHLICTGEAFGRALAAACGELSDQLHSVRREVAWESGLSLRVITYTSTPYTARFNFDESAPKFDSEAFQRWCPLDFFFVRGFAEGLQVKIDVQGDKPLTLLTASVGRTVAIVATVVEFLREAALRR